MNAFGSPIVHSPVLVIPYTSRSPQSRSYSVGSNECDCPAVSDRTRLISSIAFLCLGLAAVGGIALSTIWKNSLTHEGKTIVTATCMPLLIISISAFVFLNIFCRNNSEQNRNDGGYGSIENS